MVTLNYTLMFKKKKLNIILVLKLHEKGVPKQQICAYFHRNNKTLLYIYNFKYSV